MSTTRRRLGVGPSSIRSTPTDAAPQRLLPVERVEVEAEALPEEDIEHQGVPVVRKGRRILGSGFASASSEGVP
ncbi:hypothetical protein [Streptomyces sp. DZ1-3]|uniref:hypothetical protein n=1 Tax=Streptomyces sp. DZ1-3 TaxID=3417466 RepID=UPI003CF4BB3E